MVQQFTVRFWGVRGSIAACGRQFAKVGGNTSCVEVRIADEIIILDAGTGLFWLGESLGKPVRATFILSHYHADHIQGFPFFQPAYVPENEFTLYGPGTDASDVTGALARQMAAPHFPVALHSLAARLDFRSVRAGDEIRIGPAHVRAAALSHPQGCLGYRISLGRSSLAYATDTEPLEPEGVDADLLELVRDATLLIYDAQYTEDEYAGRTGPSRKGWGHSTFKDACRLARAAHVQHLALFHHDPTHSDRVVEQMVREARLLFPNTMSAREGITLRLNQGQLRQYRDRSALAPRTATRKRQKEEQ